MADTDKLFAGSIPEIYDRLMVPMLFEPYAADLAKRLAGLAPKTVLETAAGTGALTRAIAAALGDDVRLVATDLNQPMLDRASAALELPQRITLQQADALALPFPDQSFDAVVCQFGAMFFPDRLAGYREARRVLKPGGHFLFNVWDRIAENKFANVVSQTLAKCFPDDPPTFMQRIPHGYFDIDLVRRDLTQAGFAAVEAATVPSISKAATAHDAAVAFCQGTPLRNEIAARDTSRLDEVTTAVTDALEQTFGSGAIRGPMRAHVFTAHR